MRSQHFFALSVLFGLSLQGATFNAVTDFSSSNPSGPWKYGTASAGSLGSLDAQFTLLPTFQANCASGSGFQTDCWLGGPSVARATGAFSSSTVDFDPAHLTLHPASDMALAIVAFTAPTADTYTFSGEFTDQDNDGGSGVGVHAVLGTGTFLLNTIMPAVSSPVAINFAQSLAAGQTIYFVVSANGDWSFDSTGLALTAADTNQSGVPEPSSVILVLAGGALALLRKRFTA